MGWLVFVYVLEIGFVPSEVALTYWPGGWELEDHPQLYGELEARLIAWDAIFVRSAVTTFMAKGPGIYFYPSGVDFDFSAGLMFGGFSAGYAHRCRHPVITETPVPGVWRQWGGDRIYVRFEGGG